MAKMMSMDSQILLNTMRIQNSINDILDNANSDADIVKDEKNVNLLSFYIIKMFSLRKNFSGKTKKTLSIYNDFKYDILSKSLVSCVPLISNIEIVDFARSLADSVAVEEIKARYDLCIKESQKYEG